MFIGEMACLLIYHAIAYYQRQSHAYQPLSVSDPLEDLDDPTRLEGKKQLQGWLQLWLWLPTLCDLCGTTLLNVGLFYVAASIWQMLRGGVVLFTGVFSVVFLMKRLYLFQWLALICVTMGIGLVGMAPVLSASSLPWIASLGMHISNASAEMDSQALLGVALILLALLFAAA